MTRIASHAPNDVIFFQQGKIAAVRAMDAQKTLRERYLTLVRIIYLETSIRAPFACRPLKKFA
jgi:hypothetical protein